MKEMCLVAVVPASKYHCNPLHTACSTHRAELEVSFTLSLPVSPFDKYNCLALARVKSIK